MHASAVTVADFIGSKMMDWPPSSMAAVSFSLAADDGGEAVEEGMLFADAPLDIGENAAPHRRQQRFQRRDFLEAADVYLKVQPAIEFEPYDTVLRAVWPQHVSQFPELV